MVVYHRAVDAVDAVTQIAQIDRDGFLFFSLAFVFAYSSPARAHLVRQGRAKVTANATAPLSPGVAQARAPKSIIQQIFKS